MTTTFGKHNAFGAWAMVCVCAAFSAPSVSAATAPTDYLNMVQKFKSLHTYQANIKSTTVLQPLAAGAKPRTIPNTETIAYKSPNQFSLINSGTMGGNTVISDGLVETVYSELTQQYAVARAPGDIVSTAFATLSGTGVRWQSDSATNVQGVSVRKLVGTVPSRRGVKTVTFFIRQSDNLPYEVILSATVTTSATGNGLKIIQTALFTDERLNMPVANSLFKFSPPEGATKVGSISELSGSFGGGGLE